LRYYFDTAINHGEWQTLDADGQDLPGLGAVRDEAVGVLCDLTRDVLRDRDGLDLAVAVRDRIGAVVFRARLSLVADRPG
jgi:hypothetical protein